VEAGVPKIIADNAVIRIAIPMSWQVRSMGCSHSIELMAPARSGVLWVIPIESRFAPK
jgi:hypothetical protein